MQPTMNTLLVLILGGYFVCAIAAQTLARKYTQVLPRVQAIFAMYLGAAVISVGVGLVVGLPSISLTTASVIAFGGCITTASAYCQWQAYSHSLSKTSLLAPAGDIVATLVIALVLGEAIFYRHGSLLLAAVLLFVSAMLLGWKQKDGSVVAKDTSERMWLLWTLGMVFTSAFVVVLMKLFSATVPVPLFLVFHYVGALVGASILWLWQAEERSLTWINCGQVWLISVLIFGALGMTYWALRLAPAAIILPIQNFGTVSLAIVAGWLFFGETRQLTWRPIIGFSVGLLGLVVLGAAQIL